MSAKHDQHQGFKFLYENLYQLYRREQVQREQGHKEQAQNDGVQPFVAPKIVPVNGERPHGEAGPQNGQILKFGDTRAHAAVEAYRPMEILPRPERAAVAEAQTAPAVDTTVDHEAYQDPVIQSLKNNLSDLRELQSRLHFMLQELKEIENIDDSELSESDDDKRE